MEVELYYKDDEGYESASKEVGSHLRDYNLRKEPLQKTPRSKGFCITLRNDQGELLGGAITVTLLGILMIDVICVVEEQRGSGIGKKIMQKIEDHAKSYGYRTLILETFDFQGAVEFYKKCGYEIEFIRKGYLNNRRHYYLRKEI